MALANYTTICTAFVRLMDPLLEIVIHDLKSNKIVYINGSLSQRKVGDPSLLDIESLELSNIDEVIYPKINFDGKLIKSISVPLEGRWLLCINADISIFSKMKILADTLIGSSISAQPHSLFANDWQEKLHIAINDYLQKHGLLFDHLSSAERKSLVHHLFIMDAFNEKNAADYVAKILSLGRATVFKYLKEWRKQ